MSLVTVSCSSCDFAWIGPDVKEFAIDGDGNERQIGYPCTKAEYLRQIQGRKVIYRFGLVCLNCSTVSFLGPYDHGISDDQHPDLLNASLYHCSKCNNISLFPIQPINRGLLVRLRTLFRSFWNRGETPKPTCARCKKGTLMVSHNIVI